MNSVQLSFDFILTPIRDPESPPVAAPPAPPSTPRLSATELALQQRKRTNNIDYCNACGDPVAMINRRDIKLAWTEESIMINGVQRTLYWCKPCSETVSLDASIEPGGAPEASSDRRATPTAADHTCERPPRENSLSHVA
jgi:hypothetical protein